MVNGLGQVPIEARSPREIPVPFLPIAGQGDEKHRGHAGQPAQLRGDLVSAYAGQADV
jgi:hypothetical protein